MAKQTEKHSPEAEGVKNRMTIDHELVRAWAENREGYPGRAKGVGEEGTLKIGFKEKESGLEKVTWEEFFEIFDENDLAFVYESGANDDKSNRFFKFVRREDEIDGGDEDDDLEEDEEEIEDDEDEDDE